MSLRTGLLIGFGAGYYFGAKAGRERFEQLDRVLTKVRESEAIDTAAEKAKAVIDLSVERARDLIDSRDNPDESETVIVTPPDPTYN
jgi:hypothetical protein